MDLVRGEDDQMMVRVVPPQTALCGAKASNGAYCFSIDISGRCGAAGLRIVGESAKRGRLAVQ